MQTPHKKGVLVALVLWLPVAGGSNAAGTAAIRGPGGSQFSENSQLNALRNRATALFDAGNYVEAARAFRRGHDEADRQGESRSAVHFLNNEGGSWLAALQYRNAARVFLEARRLAQSRHDLEMDGVISLNLASLYLQLGELSGARDEARRAVAALERVPGTVYRAPALVQTAKLTARCGDFDRAVPEFLAGIQAADAEGDDALRARATSQLGYEYLNQGRLNEAERAMVEGTDIVRRELRG